MACLLAPAILLTSATPLDAAPQKKGPGKERPQERREDVKERAQEKREDVRERTQEKREDVRERAKERTEDIRDRGPGDARARGRAYARPEVSARVNAYWNRIGPARRPFTVGWYRSHPGAWRYSFALRRPWAPASYPAVARFVGINAGPVAYSYDSPTAWTADQWSALASAAKSAEPASEEDLMPLGVYSLLPPDASDSNTMVQLNISKDGSLVGSYYDMLSDTGQPIHGSLDRESQRVFWSVGENSEVAFESGLENLTNESAPVTVHMKDGAIQKWTMVRVANAGGPETSK